MRLGDFDLLADENFDAPLVKYLRAAGFDVLSVVEAGLKRTPDIDLLALAVAQGRLVLTFDSDFGTLAVRDGLPVVGVVRLRPGHDTVEEDLKTLRPLVEADPHVEPPFLLTVRRRDGELVVRQRRLEPADPDEPASSA